MNSYWESGKTENIECRWFRFSPFGAVVEELKHPDNHAAVFLAALS